MDSRTHQDSGDWLRLVPVARRLGCSEQTVRKLGDSGIIRARRTATGRRQFWRPSLEEYIAALAQRLHEQAVELEAAEEIR